MTFAKVLAMYIADQIRTELTIQKPEVSVMRDRKQHKPGDAVKGILLIIIAPIIFVILAGLIL